ncbi:2-amino-4-hydroxy-6-hydroxymethyldihydropteridine diphosphokinase [Spiribacter sp. C176]|uniref:2-amino-4-hydroxy-6-hydroxymethyldihydropteridine diphosphokinase n=1 Tax=Spiribacter salilacus TaxID=2664894 RepID=A0A6N7QP25_9GAMM|nr:2-amino-4-hydroxy-6-hydroxymethyldihydropteridine diphosphokinase [Spiribacter salilacus]MRH78275.1 2-amino-4-hydroxy-6-hydroxymethyldihydropteridine diphosphokinase [Spiribacter salilacus]
MTRTYLSIGSNIEPEKNVRAAVKALQAQYGDIVISPVYQTPAVGFAGDDFYNLVIGLDTADSVEALATACRAIETAQGRQREAQRFSARTLDIDILLFGDLVRASAPSLPRDEILKYAFVLKPLADVAPDARHPIDGRRFADLWAAFSDEPEDLEPVHLDFASA